MGRAFFDQFFFITKVQKLTVFWVFLLFFFSSFSHTFAATYYWNQSDWFGGENTTNTPNHYSKDANLKVDSDLVTLDSSNNDSLSKDYLIMTPKTQESVVNLIIDNFMESFSFVTKGKNETTN